MNRLEEKPFQSHFMLTIYLEYIKIFQYFRFYWETTELLTSLFAKPPPSPVT